MLKTTHNVDNYIMNYCYFLLLLQSEDTILPLLLILKKKCNLFYLSDYYRII